MPLLNPETGNVIDQVELTGLINNIVYQPRGFSEKFDDEAGVTIPHVLIDRTNMSLDIVDPSTYNGPAGFTEVPIADSISLHIPSYPDIVKVDPSEVAGRRQVGTETTLETPLSLLNEKLLRQTSKFALTWEYTRIRAAVFGQIVNRANQVIVNLQAQFGMGPTPFEFDFTDATADLPAAIVKWKRTLEERLGGYLISGWLIEASGEMFDKFTSHPSVTKAYERWRDGEFLRTDKRSGFMIATDVEIKEYRNATLAAKALPTGVVAPAADIFPRDRAVMTPKTTGLFATRFAPKQGMTTVNTRGLPMYSSTKDLDHDMGVEIRSESNFVHFVRVPSAVGVITQE